MVENFLGTAASGGLVDVLKIFFILTDHKVAAFCVCTDISSSEVKYPAAT